VRWRKTEKQRTSLGFRAFNAQITTRNKEALSIKYTRRGVRRKAHALPVLKFEYQSLTSFSGLVVFQQFFAILWLKARLARCFAHQTAGKVAYNLANFLRRLVVPKRIRQRTLTTLREKLIKIGVKVTRHSKYVTFQLAEVVVTRNLFAVILDRIAQLAIPPPRMARADA